MLYECHEKRSTCILVVAASRNVLTRALPTQVVCSNCVRELRPLPCLNSYDFLLKLRLRATINLDIIIISTNGVARACAQQSASDERVYT
jgi:hypothetical protein